MLGAKHDPSRCCESALQEGKRAGFDDGVNTGFNQGKDAGFNEGIESGYIKGKDTGYQTGFKEGESTTRPKVRPGSVIEHAG
jgi:flagellar biosynthesis/type III secretory pathway protein FliH